MGVGEVEINRGRNQSGGEGERNVRLRDGMEGLQRAVWRGGFGRNSALLEEGRALPEGGREEGREVARAAMGNSADRV